MIKLIEVGKNQAPTKNLRGGRKTGKERQCFPAHHLKSHHHGGQKNATHPLF